MEMIDALKKKLEPDFGSWWFLAGGSIHGLWKRRQFSQIRDLAQSLPRSAYKQRDGELKPIVDQMVKVVEAAKEIRLDYDYGGNQEADREGLPFIKGQAKLNAELAALRKLVGG
jgi:hypothetical protein